MITGPLQGNSFHAARQNKYTSFLGKPKFPGSLADHDWGCLRGGQKTPLGCVSDCLGRSIVGGATFQSQDPILGSASDTHLTSEAEICKQNGGERRRRRCSIHGTRCPKTKFTGQMLRSWDVKGHVARRQMLRSWDRCSVHLPPPPTRKTLGGTPPEDKVGRSDRRANIVKA